jgi:hypothetical protein
LHVKVVASVLSAVVLGLVCAPGRAAESDSSGVEFFEKKIRPVFVEHCYECHSGAAEQSNKLKGGLWLDSGKGIRDGGDSGAVVTAGKPAESLLIKALRHQGPEMPPEIKLPDTIIADFEAWIAAGATVPAESAPSIKPAPVDWAKARQAWAFQRPVKHGPPPVVDSSWPKNEVDGFVLAQLDARQLKPVRPATKLELIRRATFDLIGLPPTPEECSAFEQDTAPDAFARLIDRLLASPHYGERWARYWLDLARYADDQGNSFLTPAPTAYLYRDWVVRAFNRDLPYDEFVRLQLAGDLLPDPAADYIDRLAGLGFQGLGPVFRKGAAGEAKAKADELEDRVDTLSRGLLGLTVSCARCHDHKFDPIPTRDYYSLAAAYNGADWADRMLASPEAVAAHKQWEQQVQQQKADLEKWSAEQGRLLGKQALEKVDLYALAAWQVMVLRNHKQTVDDAAFARQAGLQPYFLGRWITLLQNPKDEPALAALRAAVAEATTAAMPVDGAVAVPDSLRSQAVALKGTVAAALAAGASSEQPANAAGEKPPGPSPEEQALLKLLWQDGPAPFYAGANEAVALLGDPEKTQHAERKAELERITASPPPAGPLMPSVSGGGQAMQIFVRGNPLKLGDAAPPGFLRVLSGLDEQPTGTRFTRLELARAIANPENPLTARVLVNRVWNYHFGRGIVPTLSNFGKLGSQPSHPELLDTLAAQFVESGWSIKWLHRQIMLSATYQLSSEQDPDGLAKDPDNFLLWRMTPRRLDVEAWRDAVLAVAGRLDPAIGGPALNQKDPGLKEVPGFPGFSRLNGLDVDNPANGRRTLYGIVSRYAPNPALVLFDFPEPNVTSDLRGTTTIPQQQLFVLNSQFMIEMSRAFAQRVAQAAPDDEQRVRLAWQLAYARLPTAQELTLSLNFVRTSPNVTGADVNAADANAADKLTGWEQLCHALLSSNEFMFVP